MPRGFQPTFRFICKACVLVVVLMASAHFAQASLLYQFTFSPKDLPGNVGNTIRPVTFSFTSPTFLTAGPLNFTTFQITDGTSSWTLTDGVATVDGAYCFNFGTTGAPNGCGYSFGGKPHAGDLLFLFAGTGLPTTVGVYPTNGSTPYGPAVAFANADLPAATGFYRTGGTGVLIVTGTGAPAAPSIPEPSTGAFLAIGMMGLWVRLRLRKSGRPSQRSPRRSPAARPEHHSHAARIGGRPRMKPKTPSG